MIEKRYQVFVSSTFKDLQEERQEVIQALLELDCIPAGMELFPAADEDQWTLIKKVIDDCDYYVVIVAGRYGSLGATGIGYTEMEYRYALETKKPVIGFLHAAPNKLAKERSESTEVGQKLLEDFRTLVQKKPCKFWDSAADLGSQVSRSLVKLIKSNPAVGWVRGDLVPDGPTAEEILRLKKMVDDLNAKLAAARVERPAGTEALSQGDDKIVIAYSFSATPRNEYQPKSYSLKLETTWNDVFGNISPKLIDELGEQPFRQALSEFIAAKTIPKIYKDKAVQDIRNVKIADGDFQTIKVQLRALGLIARSDKPRSVKDTGTYWTLTPYGDNMMTRLRAIAKKVPTEANDVVDQG